MERSVDFNRDRRMACRQCGHEWSVDPEWVERWNQGDENCPGCGTTCEAENAAQFTVRKDDPALDHGVTTQLVWYHTTTYADWPPTIDFADSLTDDTRRMMGCDEAVERWAHRQATKALHIGSYESAIHNMVRRMSDQGDQGNQFYLYRVYLKPEVVILPGWIPDPSNFLGDVDLDEVGGPDVEAVRYVNFHEDPGGLSLAIRPTAISTSQCLAIPLQIDEDEPWIVDAVARLLSDPPDDPLPIGLSQFRHLLGKSPRTETAAAAGSVLVERLPINLRHQFQAATRWHPESEPTKWAHCAAGIAALIENPARVLAELDAQAPREQ